MDKDITNKGKEMVKFYSIQEIAKTCNVSEKTVRRQIASGKLKAHRIGNLWRIEEKDFDDWIESEEPSSPGDVEEAPVPLQYSLFGEPVVARTKQKARTYGTVQKKDVVNWISISDAWNDELSKKYTHIDLFSGAGGLSLGMEMAGFRGLLAVEFLESAVATYRNNFDHSVIDKDIREWQTKQDVYNFAREATSGVPVDVICGGFPCQGFSMSGYRIVEDERNSLYKEMMEIIHELRPKFVVMENVVGLRSMLHGKVEEKIVNDLEELDYRVNITVMNAADYGVPQLRQRVIFIANNVGKKNYHPLPLLSPGEYRTTREAIEDLMNHPEDKTFNHQFTRHSPEMQQRLKEVPEGKSLYDNYSDAWKKTPWNELSCTIKENHGGVNIHPRLPRVLTVREMARIQSFPDHFVFHGAKKWQMVQVGNAVPPLLGKAIGLAVRKSLEENELAA